MQWSAIVNQSQMGNKGHVPVQILLVQSVHCFSVFAFKVDPSHWIQLSIEEQKTIIDSVCVCMCAWLEWQTFEFDAPLMSQQTWHYMEEAFLGFQVYKSSKQSTPFHSIAN